MRLTRKAKQELENGEMIDGSMWILTRKEIMNKNRIKKMTRNFPNKRSNSESHKEQKTPQFLNKLETKTKALFPSEKARLKRSNDKFLSINSKRSNQRKVFKENEHATYFPF